MEDTQREPVIRLIDTEVTGLVNPEVIEVAHKRVRIWGGKVENAGEMFTARYRPEQPITYGAMGVHGITNEQVKDCQPSSSFILPDPTDFIIGHNIDFDWGAIGKPDVKRIDTLALSRFLWPEADSHTQMSLIFMLDPVYASGLFHRAHSALADVEGLLFLLTHISQRFEAKHVVHLWELSEAARVPEYMPFGKHKGTRIEELPKDYVMWLIRNTEPDVYLRKALDERMAMS